MRMILAINNRNIEEKIKNIYCDKYDVFIVHSREMILEVITKDSILILKNEIEGTINFEKLINSIRKISAKITIIVLVKKLTQELKESLFSKEIFNIIEGNEFLLDDLIELINNPKMIIYKKANSLFYKSKIICVTGSKGVGKTTSAIILGRLIAKVTKKRTLIIDLDFIYPTLDTYLSINKNYSLTDYINDIIESNVKQMVNYESNDLKYKNLKYILNCKSIGIPKNEIIIKIIEHLENAYDYVIIDTSALMINKIYKLSREKKYNIVLIIEPGQKALRSFKIDLTYIDNYSFTKSIIICNKYNVLNTLPKCENDYKVIIDGGIRYLSYLKYSKSIDKIIIKTNLRKVLKEVGIIRFENFKLKLIEKILNIEEVKK